MEMTARALNRATLARQLLLRRKSLDVVEAVHHVLALQAQQPASPYVALWNRLAPFDPADLDEAFAAGTVLKATLMRITLHAVAAGDYPDLHTAMQRTLRGARLGDRRFKTTGLTPADADALVPDLQAFLGKPRTKAEAEAWLEERLGTPPEMGVWWALRQYAPVRHAPTGPPWSFANRPSYVAAPTALPEEDDWEAALQALVLGYLRAFGPATTADIAQFGMLLKPPLRAALEGLSGSLEVLEGPGGVELYDVPDGLRPAEDVPAPPRLMAMWDSILLAYADRSRVIPPHYRTLVIRRNGDVLPTLLVDGHVAGVWRPVDDGIEATAFHPLADADWDGLATEATSLRALLADREPTVYSRYGRWWDDLPAAEVRVLG